jgi:spore photoproduct lyase
MFEHLEVYLPEEAKKDLTFEFIQHRFTKPAKRVIEKNYPMTKLELNEEERRYKWSKYGIGKYIYQKDEEQEMKDHLYAYMEKHFPKAKLEYFT